MDDCCPNPSLNSEEDIQMVTGAAAREFDQMMGGGDDARDMDDDDDDEPQPKEKAPKKSKKPTMEDDATMARALNRHVACHCCH